MTEANDDASGDQLPPPVSPPTAPLPPVYRPDPPTVIIEATEVPDPPAAPSTSTTTSTTQIPQTAPAAPPSPQRVTVIGIDIGGTGIKGAPCDLVRGEFAADRLRIETPHPATPDAVADVVARVVAQLGGTGPVGVTLPAVVRAGVVETAANIDPSWIGTNAVDLLSSATGRTVAVVNDADAAGVAEMRYGAGRDRRGVVMMVTLGTGIGTALFVDGTLVPNTELGHLPLKGGDAEDYAAESVREAEGLTYKEWAKRLQKYLRLVERLMWPELIIIGGGISKKSDKFLPHIHLDTPIVPAQLHNDAGIVGAALFAPPA
jgi:polyphosphate glucokinase